MLQTGQWAGTRAAIVTADQNDVAMGFGHARRNGSDPDFRHQLYADAGAWIRVLQVVDELCQVLDRVDIVVRWRADQTHAGGRVAHLGDPRPYLVTGQLATFARLGALCHLDLQFVGVHKIFAGYTETAGSHLFDGTAAAVAVGVPHES